MARVGMAACCVAGAAGLGWGVTESHSAAVRAEAAVRDQREIAGLLRQHSRDIKIQQETDRALSGAVLYVEESIAAVCAATHANCPRPPGAVP